MGGPCIPAVRLSPSQSSLNEFADEAEKDAKQWEATLNSVSQGEGNPCAQAARQEVEKAANCLEAEAASIQLMIWGLNEVNKRIHDLVKNYSPRALASYEACAAKRDAGWESFIGAIEAITGQDFTSDKSLAEKTADQIGAQIKGEIMDEVFKKGANTAIGNFSKGLKLGQNIPAVKEAEIGVDCMDAAVQGEIDAKKDLEYDRQVTEEHLQNAIDRYNACSQRLEAAIQQYEQMQSDEVCMEGVPVMPPPVGASQDQPMW